MAPTVEIILPTHRRPHTIGCAIKSVLLQTEPNFRLHVVGDGCDDATEAVVRSFQDERVRFHRFAKGKGLGYANRNRVLRETSAAHIAYVTDDDLWFPDHLERGLRELRKHGCGLVSFRSCPVRFPGTIDPNFFAFDWHAPVISGFLRNWFTGALTCVHHRRVFDQVGYWDERLERFGDREFWQRVQRAGIPCAHLDEITVLRFYALQWDHHYGSCSEPPQKHFLEKLQSPEWCRSVRQATAPGRRSLAVRRRQWRDFLLFGLRSGPKFAQFVYHRLTTTAGDGRLTVR